MVFSHIRAPKYHHLDLQGHTSRDGITTEPKRVRGPQPGGRFSRCKARGAKVPALLHTNQDAQEEAMRRYSLESEQELDGKPIFIDFSRNIMVFDGSTSLMTSHLDKIPVIGIQIG